MYGQRDNVTSNASASPIPTPVIEPTLAPGKRGPIGLAPRTNYSRVNTGTPSLSDVASEQKSMPPRGAELLPKMASMGGEVSMNGKVTPRPLLQEIVKNAVANSVARSIEKEAADQRVKLAAAPPISGTEEEGAVTLTEDTVDKLAGALDYLADTFLKQAENGPGSGPGALQVTQALDGSAINDDSGQARHQPQAPSLQSGGSKATTQLANDMDRRPGGSAEMVQNNSGKTASIFDQILAKVAEEKEEEKLEKEETKGMSEARKGLARAEAAHAKEAGALDRLKNIGKGLAESVGKSRPVQLLTGSEARRLEARAAPGASHEGYRHLLEEGAKTERRKVNIARGAAAGTALGVGGGAAVALHKKKDEGVPAEEAKTASFFERLAGRAAEVVKQAEDAINPAQISAGKAVPPATLEAEEPGGAPVGGMPSGPRGLVHSAQSAINMTRGQAYAPRKAELQRYLSEPALSAATDKVLNNAFSHAGEAGPKVASADPMSLAAAAGQALLQKIAAEAQGSGKSA